MELSYNNTIFDTGANTRIAASSDASIDGFVRYLIDHAPLGRPLPAMIGIVSPHLPFFSNLSIIENIVLPLEYHRNLRTREAVELIWQQVVSFGLQEIIKKRKEAVQRIDLLKAMVIRALSLDPEVVLFVNPHLLLSLSVFETEFRQLMAFTRQGKKFWIAMTEGLRLAWEYEREVSLDV